MDFKNFKRFNTFLGKTILCIDYGMKITGMAAFTPGREPFPYPFGRLIYESDEKLIKDLGQIIDDEVIEVLVIGVPRLLDGQETEQTKKHKLFANLLATSFPELEVFQQDETLSTKEAQDRMMSSPQYNFKVDPKKIDEVAATIILEDFIKSEI